MGVFKKVGKAASYLVNIRVDQWFGVNNIKSFGVIIINNVKQLLTPAQPMRLETFEEALQRLNITEEQLQEQASAFNRYLIIFIIFTIAIFLYSIYIAILGNIWGFFVGFGLTIFSISQVFKYHFWLYQIKNRKLGCSIEEWLNDNKTKD